MSRSRIARFNIVKVSILLKFINSFNRKYISKSQKVFFVDTAVHKAI